ncbi:MAG: chitobiase/beta-hexosaminidase C-terminal domain-containing protein [Verrucomicrobiota bacterium]|nr:chitobiase/beta-hexosaminidase C-terminal domain-containing protein [Verrucomicrobiota bacterium]
MRYPYTFSEPTTLRNPIKSALLGLILLISAVPCATQAAALGGGYLNSGLTGAYYANDNFSGSPQFSRSDVRIAFAPETTVSWGGSNGTPFTGYPTTNFSVRWTGQLKARYSETYTYRAIADDSLKLEIKPASGSTWTTVINQASYVPAGTTGTFAMTAGTAYDVRVEFKQLTASAMAVLKWSSTSTQEEIIDVASEFSINWNTYREQTFANAIKGGRSNWEPSGGVTPTLDAEGWPQGDFDFIVSESLSPYDISPMETGDMRLTFKGRATVGTFGNCSLVAGSQSYDTVTNTTTATIRGVDNNGNVMNVRFSNTDRDGDYGADGIADKDGLRDVKLMRLDQANGTSLPNDMLFHPKFREAFERVTAFRFQRTNDQCVNWSQRSQPYYTFPTKSNPYIYNSRYGYTLSGSTQLSHEWEIMLCNELGADYYVTVPHMASTAGTGSYIEKLAKLIRYGSDSTGEPYSAPTANPVYPPLNSNLRVYVEIANELWNFASLSSYAPYFDYREVIEDKADANDADFVILNYDNLPKTLDAGGYYTNNYTWVRRYWGLKLKQISDCFRGVFGDGNMPGNGNREPRIRPYFTWQYANANATAEVGLKFMDDYFNNAAGNFVGTPRPVNYYFWCAGGAGYYSSANNNAFVEINPIPNSSFETPTVTTYEVAPAGASATFTGTAGIVKNVTLTNAVSAATPGASTTALTNYVGQKLTVGATAITVYELGRWVISGNNKSHNLRIARASDGKEVTAASVSTSGATAGAFVYGKCVPVTLQANTVYYLLSEEASAADAVGDATGSVTTNGAYAVTVPATATYNSTTKLFTFTDGAGAGKSYGPVALKYANAITLASGTPMSNPDVMAGAQTAWIQTVNGATSRIDIPFTLPGTQIDNHYAFSFRWVQRTQYLNGTPDAAKFKLFTIVNGTTTTDITPNDPNTQPAQWSTSNLWKRVSYWVGDYYYSANFTAPAGASVTLRFETNNTTGDHLAFIDDLRLTSADAFYASEIPSTGTAMGQTAGTYLGNQEGDAHWCAAFGLMQMTYEHGFSAGGDSGNSAIQNYVKFSDPRAKQSVIDCVAIFQRAGGRLPTYGTYSTWPAFETIDGIRVDGTMNSGSYPLTQGMDEMLSRLPEVPTNGTTIPAIITGASKTLARGGTGQNTLNAANTWYTYNIVVPQSRTYAVGVDTTAGGTVELSLGSNLLIASGTSGTIRSGTVYLPWGHHAIRVRNTSGTFNVTSVIIDNSTVAAQAPTGFNATLLVPSLNVALAWADNSSGSSQESWFEIERATDTGFTANVAKFQMAVDATSWTDTTQLAVATTYYYRIRAFNLAGASAWVAVNGGSGVYVNVPAPSHTLYASDDFGTSARSLYATATGSGWNGAWTVQNNDVVIPGFEVRTASPLSYAGLSSSGSGYAIGGKGYLSAGRQINLTSWPYYFKKTVSSNSYLGADGTVIYASALVRVDKANTSGAYLSFSSNTNASDTGSWKAGLIINNSKWSLRLKNASNAWVMTDSTITPTLGQTYLVVLKLVFGATDSVSLFINPTTLGGTEPTPTLTASAGSDLFFHTLTFNPDESAEQGSMDDVRIGDSYASVTPPQSVSAPTFSLAAGTYNDTQSVTISTSTAGASIRYTTDGSTPTSTTGTVYGSAVSIATTTTLKAIAYKTGMNDSTVSSALYTIDRLPLITTTSLPDATQGSAYSTTIIATSGDGVLSFSISSGSLPAGLVLSSAGVISGTPTVSGTSPLTALVTDADGDTDTQALSLNVVPTYVAIPSISPAGGTYGSQQSVTLACATSGATIRYSTDGSTPSPTVGSTYSGAIVVAQNTTVKAMAYKNGLSDSAVNTAVYTIKTAAPTFSVPAGTYATAQTVSLSTTTSGASIRYTTDGSTPSAAVGTVYSTPILVSTNTTLRAVAYKAGMADSDVSMAGYLIGAGDMLLAEESFNYATGTLVEGLVGGGSFGWNGAWVVESGLASTGYKVAANSLAYGDLYAAGNQLEGGFSYRTTGRAFDVTGVFAGYKNAANRIGLDGTTLWLSWVVKLGSTASGYSGKVALDYSGSIFHDNLGIVRVKKNDTSGQWQLGLLNDTLIQATGVAATTNPTLMVVRIQFGATDTVSLWVNPQLYASNPGTPQATLSTTGAIEFNEITYYPQSGPVSGWIDEIRAGTAYTTVTPTTEVWLPGDIGAVAAAGSTTISPDGNTFTAIGSGADIWGTADEFHFCRLQNGASGDSEIVARVASIQNTNGWAKAGVMIRENTTAGARQVSMIISPSNGVSFQRRTTAGGTSASTTTAAITAPRWVKLVRTGNSFTGFYSSDGVAWVQVGSAVTIAMGTATEIGLCVTSHADGTLCQTILENVSVTR